MSDAILDRWQSDDGAVTLLLGDCLKILPGLEGIAAIVTDPPFGRAFSSSWDGINKGNQIAGDEDTETRDAMLQIMGNIPALVFGSWRHPVAGAKQAIVWDKGPASGMGDLSIPWKESWELIFVCGRGFKGFRDEGIIRGHTIVTWASKGRVHQNQKPVGLLQVLVEKTPETIADPFMGSGTTGVACIRTGRRFIGIEIERRYWEISVSRCKAELERFPLFEKQEKLRQLDLISE